MKPYSMNTAIMIALCAAGTATPCEGSATTHSELYATSCEATSHEGFAIAQHALEVWLEANPYCKEGSWGMVRRCETHSALRAELAQREENHAAGYAGCTSFDPVARIVSQTAEAKIRALRIRLGC